MAEWRVITSLNISKWKNRIMFNAITVWSFFLSRIETSVLPVNDILCIWLFSSKLHWIERRFTFELISVTNSAKCKVYSLCSHFKNSLRYYGLAEVLSKCSKIATWNFVNRLEPFRPIGSMEGGDVKLHCRCETITYNESYMFLGNHG